MTIKATDVFGVGSAWSEPPEVVLSGSSDVFLLPTDFLLGDGRVFYGTFPETNSVTNPTLNGLQITLGAGFQAGAVMDAGHIEAGVQYKLVKYINEYQLASRSDITIQHYEDSGLGAISLDTPVDPNITFVNLLANPLYHGGNYNFYGEVTDANTVSLIAFGTSSSYPTGIEVIQDSRIKSIQRVSGYSGTTTVTINDVDMSKSWVNAPFVYISYGARAKGRYTLISSTQVQITVSEGTHRYYLDVIEYY